MNQNIQSIKNDIEPILRRYGVVKAAVFGSVARSDNSEKSDIDILVQIDKDLSLLDFVGLKMELEEKLDKKVDLVEYDAVKRSLKENILSNQVVLYE